MLAARRQEKIVELIREKGSVQVDELAEHLKVSPMTIRRDLVKLQENNQVERCHGGAVAKQEVAYADKQISHCAQKKLLAQRSAAFVSRGDRVFLDAGTTTYEIAGFIRNIPDILAVTNDLEIAELLKDSDVELLMCGGTVQKSTGSIWGYYATQMLLDFRFDVGFFGAASINDDFQVMTPTIEKAFLKRETAKRCRKSYLVADASKFGRQAMNKVNDLGDYTAVITDKTFTEAEMKRLWKMGAEVERANM